MLLWARQVLYTKVTHFKTAVSGEKYDRTGELTTHLAVLLLKYYVFNKETRSLGVKMT